jgi:hypothetical protein
MLLQVTLRPAPGVQLIGRLKYRDAEQFSPAEAAPWIYPRQSSHKRRISSRAEIIVQRSNRLRLKLRLEGTRSASAGGTKLPVKRGFSIFHEIHATPTPSLRLTARYVLFDIPDYDARQYHFEPDLPGLLFNQLIYGRGVRWFVLAKF